MEEVEIMVREHIENPEFSRLSSLISTLGSFFTELRLVDALNKYDKDYAVRNRRFIPPSFTEIRHILNLAQLSAICKQVKLMTFDADGTLFDDGHNLEKGSSILEPLMQLMEKGIYVAIVTAAGYPANPKKYEERFGALLQEFKSRKYGPEILQRFLVIGGECNYLFITNEDCTLKYVGDTGWQIEEFSKLVENTKGVEYFLDESQKCLTECAKNLQLLEKLKFIRKPRAVGLISLVEGYVPRTEAINEMVIATQYHLRNRGFPFCAFNSGKDVWVDVGHKSIGVKSIQKYLKIYPRETLHVGDQMSIIGNDYLVRTTSCTWWVNHPKETQYLLNLLIKERGQ